MDEVEKIKEPEVQDEGTKVEQEKDDKNLCNGFPVSDMPKAIIQGLSTQYSNVQVKIVEQPAPNKVRFRWDYFSLMKNMISFWKLFENMACSCSTILV